MYKPRYDPIIQKKETMVFYHLCGSQTEKILVDEPLSIASFNIFLNKKLYSKLKLADNNSPRI
ncbi:MAG: hypothetical protein GPJ51_06530 [Candidatus Heimdallarchaeota archaeon]|nr:hypothetical protein [Candidatus Heimdallarchaeota archaeon]